MKNTATRQENKEVARRTIEFSFGLHLCVQHNSGILKTEKSGMEGETELGPLIYWMENSSTNGLRIPIGCVPNSFNVKLVICLSMILEADII